MPVGGGDKSVLMKRQLTKTASAATDLLWMGCVDSKRASFTTAVYAIMISMTVVAATPILYFRYEDRFRNFLVFIYIGVLPFAGWIPMSLLLICGTIKGWTKLAFVWMLYTIILIMISLLEICYWIRTFMELFKQHSFRPDMLGIIGILLVITVINCFCIDVVSAYRRQKLKEMTNVSPGYAAFLLQNLMKMDIELERDGDMRCLGQRSSRDSSRDTDTTPAQSPPSTLITTPSEHHQVDSVVPNDTDRCAVLVNFRRTSDKSDSVRKISDLSCSKAKPESDLGENGEKEENEGKEEEEDGLGPLQSHVHQPFTYSQTPHIRQDKRYSVVRLENGRMGLLEEDGLAGHGMRRLRSVMEGHGHYMGQKRKATRSKSNA